MVNHFEMSEVTSELQFQIFNTKFITKMEITEACDEREEGEIIEDDLEDVSDSSMLPGSPLDSGKSVSPPELLSAVCLSSVSSNDYCKPCGRTYYDQTHNKRQWRHKRKRKIDYDIKRRNHVRHRKKIEKIDICSESDDDLVDPKYAKQLKDALKRESPQELHNSLRTRLKAFIEPTSDEDALRNMALLSTKTCADENTLVAPSEVENNEVKHVKNLIMENFEDSELFELRMAALKSVVLEKHERRKKRTQECTNNVDVANDKHESSDIDKENDQSVINNDVDVKCVVESEALLKQDVGDDKKDDLMEDDVDILRAMLLANMSKSLATTKVMSSETKIPQEKRIAHKSRLVNHHVTVKPLIINVNGDSDSDTDIFQHYDTEKSLKETVTQFLKKQRAEVEENVKKKEPAVDSFSINKSEDSLMDKSVMQLLPRSQQIEYRQLKQRLLNARKKVRTRRSSQRISESKRDLTQSIKKVPKVKVVADPSGSSNSSVNGKVVKSVHERNKIIQPASNLQKTLNELQIRKNGRLQMKGKYRSLGVLLHRINHASNIRRQHELEIKKLLHEIQKSRIKLATSHQNFTNLVQQLVKEKQVIDQRTYKSSAPVTSTPNKIVPCQQKSVENSGFSEETVRQEQELLEPNDVTKVFDAQLDALPKYISPLDNRDGNGIGNALMTFCPYDVLGTCKDKECQYVHFT